MYIKYVRGGKIGQKSKIFRVGREEVPRRSFLEREEVP
jgi:hypothetical protein